jgi:hypothetical protein
VEGRSGGADLRSDISRLPFVLVGHIVVLLSEHLLYDPFGRKRRWRCLEALLLADLHDPSYVRPVGNKKAGALRPGL